MSRTISVTDDDTGVTVAFTVDTTDHHGTPHISTVTVTAAGRPLRPDDLLMLPEIGLPLPGPPPARPGRPPARRASTGAANGHDPDTGPAKVAQGAKRSPPAPPPMLDLDVGHGNRGMRWHKPGGKDRPEDDVFLAAWSRFNGHQRRIAAHFEVSKGTVGSWVSTFRRNGVLPDSKSKGT